MWAMEWTAEMRPHYPRTVRLKVDFLFEPYSTPSVRIANSTLWLRSRASPPFGQERSTQAACVDNQIRPGELTEIVRDASLPDLPKHSV